MLCESPAPTTAQTPVPTTPFEPISEDVLRKWKLQDALQSMSKSVLNEHLPLDAVEAMIELDWKVALDELTSAGLIADDGEIPADIPVEPVTLVDLGKSA